MPASMLKSLADKANVSMGDAEKKWDKAKKIVDDQYNYSKTDDRYWSLVTGITKKMLGLSESISEPLRALIDFDNGINHLFEENLLEESLMILEAGGELTYYELRQMVAHILKYAKKKESKTVLDDLLKTLGKLEIMNKPVPVIRKIKTVSPSIF